MRRGAVRRFAPVCAPIIIGDDVGVVHAHRVSNGASFLQVNAAGAISSSATLAFGSVRFGTTSG